MAEQIRPIRPLTVDGVPATDANDGTYYTLGQGTLIVHGNEYIGYFSPDSGIFDQSSGSNSATGSGSIIIGESSGSTGDYNVSAVMALSRPYAKR